MFNSSPILSGCWVAMMLTLACTTETTSRQFDTTKWQFKKGEDHPFRAQMVDSVLYNDTIRSLSQAEITRLLGKASYTRERNPFWYFQSGARKVNFEKGRVGRPR